MINKLLFFNNKYLFTEENDYTKKIEIQKTKIRGLFGLLDEITDIIYYYEVTYFLIELKNASFIFIIL